MDKSEKSPNYEQIMQDQTFNVERKTIKSTQEIIESITMIKDLMNTNGYHNFLIHRLYFLNGIK